MTDPTPTPTRAEVEALAGAMDAAVSRLVGKKTPSKEAAVMRALSAENQALRERAEAAENERDELRNYFKSAGKSFDILVAERNAARRAEGAAWDNAIEAISDDDLIAAMMAIEEMELQYRWFEKWRGTMDGWKGEHFGDCTNAPISCLRCAYEAARERLPGFKAVLRALRRAAPTEGEA